MTDPYLTSFFRPSPQGDGDPSPMRMTLAGPPMTAFDPKSFSETQQVWLLWRNETVLGVFTEDRAWREMHELMASTGSLWWTRVDDYARVWHNANGVTLRMEPREVHR